jgi:hypothetical protein
MLGNWVDFALRSAKKRLALVCSPVRCVPGAGCDQRLVASPCISFDHPRFPSSTGYGHMDSREQQPDKAFCRPDGGKLPTVFSHLLNAEDRIWGQMDSVPVRGEAPTTSWLEGEVISDQHKIVVDPEAPPGEYIMEIGMYDANTGQRLPVFSDDQALQQDRLLLGVVQVVP